MGRIYGEDGSVTSTYCDTVTLSRLQDNRIGLTSQVYMIDSVNRTISKVPKDTTVEQFRANLDVLYNGTLRILGCRGQRPQ